MRLLDGFGLIAPLSVTGEPPLASAGLCEIFGFELELSKSGRGQILEPWGLAIDLCPFPAIPRFYFSRKRGEMS